MQLPASEAREKCVHEWMKDALDVFLCQLTELQSMEEEQHSPTTTLSDFFVAEESTIVAHHERKEEQIRLPYLIDLFTAEESVIGIVTNGGLPKEDISCCHILPLTHLQRKEDDCCVMNCSLEFLRTEEQREIAHKNVEDDVVSGCLIS
jgi:hypothetical protein